MGLLYSSYPMRCDPGYNFSSILVTLFFEIYKRQVNQTVLQYFAWINQKVDHIVSLQETIKGKWVVPFLLLTFLLVDFFWQKKIHAQTFTQGSRLGQYVKSKLFFEYSFSNFIRGNKMVKSLFSSVLNMFLIFFYRRLVLYHCQQQILQKDQDQKALGITQAV